MPNDGPLEFTGSTGRLLSRSCFAVATVGLATCIAAVIWHRWSLLLLGIGLLCILGRATYLRAKSAYRRGSFWMTQSAAPGEATSLLPVTMSDSLSATLSAASDGRRFQMNQPKSIDQVSALVRAYTPALLPDLTVTEKSELVLALADYAHYDPAANLIQNIFLDTHDIELIQLKELVEVSSGLHRLLYRRKMEQNIRIRILKHFREEFLKRPLAEKGISLVQILSDIDDTFYAALLDGRYERHTVYPGVKAFMKHLGTGPSMCRSPTTTFLTARPELLRDQTVTLMKSHGVDNVTLLMGEFKSMFSNMKMAMKKLENFLQYHLVFPEKKMIFMGDNGQGDIELGKQLINQPSVLAVFIHDIYSTGTGGNVQHKRGPNTHSLSRRRSYSDPSVPFALALEEDSQQRSSQKKSQRRQQELPTLRPRRDRDAMRQQGILLYRNYIDAAIQAYESKLMSEEGMVEVARSAMLEIQNSTFVSGRVREKRYRELMYDVSNVLSKLSENEAVRLLQDISPALL